MFTTALQSWFLIFKYCLHFCYLYQTTCSIFSHNEKVLQNKLANNEYCINRDRVGVVTSNLSHLVRDTLKLLGDQDHYERIICSFVDENIFNFSENRNRCVDKICSIVGV